MRQISMQDSVPEPGQENVIFNIPEDDEGEYEKNAAPKKQLNKYKSKSEKRRAMMKKKMSIDISEINVEFYFQNIYNQLFPLT